MLKLELDVVGRTNSAVEECHDLRLHSKPVNKAQTGAGNLNIPSWLLRVGLEVMFLQYVLALTVSLGLSNIMHYSVPEQAAPSLTTVVKSLATVRKGEATRHMLESWRPSGPLNQFSPGKSSLGGFRTPIAHFPTGRNSVRPLVRLSLTGSKWRYPDLRR